MNQEKLPLTKALDGQGEIKPGTEGYWEIWGASAREIRPGDLVMVRWANKDGSTKEITEHEVVTVQESAPTTRITDTDGNAFRIGWLQRFKLFRWGTHHTLSDWCR